MPFRTEVDLGPGHIVLDGDPTPPRKGELAHVYCGHGRPSQLMLSSCHLNVQRVSKKDSLADVEHLQITSVLSEPSYIIFYRTMPC